MTVLSETRARLERIASEDSHFRAFIRVDADEALAAASANDQRRAAGRPLSALDGLAVAVKDNLAVKGKPWTGGIAGRHDLIAGMDATAVAHLRAAGAVLIGGANMEEAALGAVTDNPAFGQCMNPLGQGLTPGGSSGGSAAAVAAGFVDLALGTDTLGSVRVPAAYCGIFGIKPTFGAIDRFGQIMLSPSLDTIGPMSRDIGLLWPALEAMATKDARATWSKSHAVTDLSGIKFGVPDPLRTVACEPAVLAGLQRAKDAITRAGGSVRDIDLAGWNPGKSRRAGLLVAEAEGAAELSELIDRPDAISDRLRAMLIYGRDAPAEKLAAARSEIAIAAQSAEQAFEGVDAILLPTAPQRAFPHGMPAPSNQADLTALANFAGCPAVALPVPLQGEILPASVQVMGPRWSDPELLARAEVLAKALATTAPT